MKRTGNFITVSEYETDNGHVGINIDMKVKGQRDFNLLSYMVGSLLATIRQRSSMDDDAFMVFLENVVAKAAQADNEFEKGRVRDGVRPVLKVVPIKS